MAIYFDSNRGYLTCSAHGGKLSSDCGTFDAPCGQCEYEMDEADDNDMTLVDHSDAYGLAVEADDVLRAGAPILFFNPTPAYPASTTDDDEIQF